MRKRAAVSAVSSVAEAAAAGEAAAAAAGRGYGPPPAQLPVWAIALASRAAVLLLCACLAALQRAGVPTVAVAGAAGAAGGASGGALEWAHAHAYDSSSHLGPAGTSWLSPLAHWDGAHMLSAAAGGWPAGWRTDLSFAFFPAFPAAARAAGGAAAALGLTRAGADAALLGGLALNLVAFCLAAELLQALGRAVLRSGGALAPRARLSDRAAAAAARAGALFFAATPAGIFMSAFYAEALFAAASFAGMLACEAAVAAALPPAPARMSARRYAHGAAALAAGALVFTFAAAARSNGVLLTAYVAYAGVRMAAGVRSAGAAALLAHGVLVAACCAAVVAPLAMHAWQAEALFCGGAAPPAWCAAFPLPAIYAHVQRAYWGNGFLAYVAPRHAPDYVLGAPMLALAAVAAHRALAPRERRAAIAAAVIDLACARRARTLDATAAYAVHFAAMAVLAALFMHVQVVTRFAAACPALYWVMAALWTEDGDDGAADGSGGAAERGCWRATCRPRTLLPLYCTAFTAVGTTLFFHALPWT